MMAHDVGHGLVVLTVLLAAVVGYEYPCTYTSKTGDYYDLSPLSLCDASGYTVHSDSDGNFTINVCNIVSGCNGNAAVCQSIGETESLGSASNISFSDYSGGKGVTLVYGGGDSNGCPSDRSTILNFICDPSASTPNFTFVKESPLCLYHFNVFSKIACPTTKAPQIELCPLYVYLMPHTHDDVGWLKTIDDYYQSEVKSILDTVVASLMENKERKFIYVEQAFFWRWWNDPNTSNKQRANLKTLYENGQFEFVIGGWVMQDEACTTYGADIEQMTLGHQFLLNTFGARPTKGWQIDPFGASSVTPTLNKLSGFDAHILDRVTFKDEYEADHTMQFNWKGSPSLGSKAEIFTQVLDGGGYAYCDWLSVFGFESNPVNNASVEYWAETFYAMAIQRRAHFKSNVLLAAWGCDFAFQDAEPMFESMDFLIQYMQKQEKTTNIYVKYGTLSDYFSAVMELTNITYPTNNGSDFFPLFEDLYWTGYYTSRSVLKGLTRQGEAVSHVVEPIVALTKILRPTFDTTGAFANITTLRLANADAQHHDGVTGTSNPNVVVMYENDLRNGMDVALDTAALLISNYISNGKIPNTLTTSSAALVSLAVGQTVAVVIYNSLGWQRSEYVVLPVNLLALSVVDSNNKTVPSQINPTLAINATGKYNLFFQTSIPPLGFETYFITAGGSPSAKESYSYETTVGAATVLTNGYLSVTVSGSTNLISNVTNHVSGISAVVDQNIKRYVSENSGAYAFGPAGPAVPVAFQPPTTTVHLGPLVSEAYQVFNTGKTSFVKQNIRLYKSSNQSDQLVSGYFEMDYQIGVLPSHTEVVTTFSTSIQNQRLFSTDDNGFEFLTRERSVAPSIEGNYYPTIYASYIKDNHTQLSVFSDRSHGVTSLVNGELELMIHRNPDMTDNFGPGLTDTDVVLPVVRIAVDTPAASPLQTRIQPLLLNFPLTVFYGTTTSAANWKSSHNTSAQFVSSVLPPNVHFLSLNALDGTSSTKSIFRLTHLFAVGEDPVYSKPATVDVQLLFSKFKIRSFVETTLTANNVIDTPTSTVVVLNPKEIRTFIISF